MVLIIGGAYQGKTEAALEIAGEEPDRVMNRVHEWIRERMEAGADQDEIWDELFEITERRRDMIFVADEIGCGIVPVDAFERKYRETAGRILCGLAKQADEVYRVVAGIPGKIKG